MCHFCYHSKHAAMAEISSTAPLSPPRGHEVERVRRSSKEGACEDPRSRLREQGNFFPDRLQWKPGIGHYMPCIPALHSFQVFLRHPDIGAGGDAVDASRQLFSLRSETIATSAVKTQTTARSAARSTRPHSAQTRYSAQLHTNML